MYKLLNAKPDESVKKDKLEIVLLKLNTTMDYRRFLLTNIISYLKTAFVNNKDMHLYTGVIVLGSLYKCIIV